MLSLDSVLTVIRYIFNDETRDDIAQSFESIRVAIKNIEHTSYNIDTLMTYQRVRLSNIMSHVESITFNLRSNNDKISHTISNFSSISDSIAKANISATITKTNTTMAELSTVVSKINEGKGSLGLLVNNDTLYRNLAETSNQIELLLEDMRLNPKRYVHFSVFGRSSKKNQYSPPQK